MFKDRLVHKEENNSLKFSLFIEKLVGWLGSENEWVVFSKDGFATQIITAFILFGKNILLNMANVTKT